MRSYAEIKEDSCLFSLIPLTVWVLSLALAYGPVSNGALDLKLGSCGLFYPFIPLESFGLVRF